MSRHHAIPLSCVRNVERHTDRMDAIVADCDLLLKHTFMEAMCLEHFRHCHTTLILKHNGTFYTNWLMGVVIPNVMLPKTAKI